MTRTYFKTAKRRREAREDNEAWPGGPERRLYAHLGGVGFKTGSIAKDLQERGLVEHSSAPIEEILHTRRKVYVGVDPTADSLHVGHLAWILLMKRLGEAGNALHFLVGGGTGLIGDPKEKGERPMLDARTVAANARALKKQLKGILGRTRFTMLDNADWLTSIKLIPFLRDIGKHFSVNELIKRDLIRNRLETPNESISYTEFTYSLLQGYDFLTLYKTRGVSLQIGGSDQWTNILSGVELIRKHLGKQAYALSIPLVMDAAGKKLGKSEGNAVWLNPKKTSPFAFYQYWMRLPDDTLERFLMVYTFIPIADIRALMVRHREAPHEREAQETLARAVTELVHGPAAVAAAVAATDALFGDKPLSECSREACAVVASEAPSVSFSKKEVRQGIPLMEALIKGGLASSKTEARRLIEGKSVTLSGMTIENPEQKVYPGDFKNGIALVRKGKRDVLALLLK